MIIGDWETDREKLRAAMNAPVTIVKATDARGSVNGMMTERPAFIRLSTSTTWWTVAMASKHPLAANVAQTSETMSVAGNAPGILNVPMSALGKAKITEQTALTTIGGSLFKKSWLEQSTS